MQCSRFVFSLVVALAVVGTPAFAAETADPLDWAYWRGPEGNSISRETGLPDTINPEGGEGSNLLWKVPEAAGRSTPIVLNGKLYMTSRDNPGTPLEREKVQCLDAATGKVLWENKFNVYSSSVPDTRVGWSSVVGDPATGNIYALGVNGLFQCIDGETGKTIWSTPMHERFGLVSTYGGRTNFPIIADDLVIIGAVMVGWGDMATPSHRLIGFDKLTGEVRWFISTRLRPEDTIYSPPVLTVIDGQKVLIGGSGDGYVYGFQPATGKELWKFRLSRRGLNAPPTIDNGVVYMGHNEENPPPSTKIGALYAINARLSGDITPVGDDLKGEIWSLPEVGAGRSGILVLGDRLYCCDDAGKMLVFDKKTGEQIGRKLSLGTTNFATPLFADGKIYVLEKSRWYILTPDEEDGVQKPVRGKTSGMFPSGAECFASPIVSHGRLYIRNTDALYCFEDKAKQHGVTERPPQPEVLPVSGDQKPAQALLVPPDVLMRPGEKLQFKVRLYNARGQFLKESPAKFDLEGPGKIAESGEYTAPAGNEHTASYLTATVDGIAAEARIRSIPPLPWKFDFEGQKEPPVTWVGVRYRHVMRPVDGSQALVKINTIPKGTRSRLAMGQSDLSNYTVQADIKAGIQDKQVPDFGIIAQGYTFFVEGQIKRMQIQSWMAHDKRTFVAQPFTLEPNVWYTMKLRAENTAGQALLRAKLWKRGEKEPEAWTLELVDPQPNTSGSPGMYADATNAEVYIDNVSVTPN